MAWKFFTFFGILTTCGVIVHGQNNNDLRAEFRQFQEPQFQAPLPPLNFQPQPQQQFQFQQRQFQQQQQLQQQPQALPQQQRQQQPASFQQPQQQLQQQPQLQQRQQGQQQQVQQQPQQNFQDFANFNSPGQGQEALPTLPPVFIPPNNPVGPPPQLQSPIRNLFRQPSSSNSDSNTFSLSNIISRFLNLFNLNNN